MSNFKSSFSAELRPQVLEHIKEWSSCNKCSLHKTRHKGCLFRGHIFSKTNIVIIGEAPGDTEDTIGQPFVGKSGQLLQDILNETYEEIIECDLDYKIPFIYTITNTVACIPKTDNKVRPPSKNEMTQCLSRVVDILVLCSPQLVITLGKVAHSQLKNYTKQYLQHSTQPAFDHLHLDHPATMLRKSDDAIELYKLRSMSQIIAKLNTIYS